MSFVAKPTTYNGVRFRSRLEARWAAFFDLNAWKWSYEPVDLAGWVPDFILHMPLADVYVEVKPASPVDSSNTSYKKAFDYWRKFQVLLLGVEPESASIGALLDPPLLVDYQWVDLHESMRPSHEDRVAFWREAGNLTQWKGDGARP